MSESKKLKSVSRNNSIIVPPDKVLETVENLEECEEFEDEGFDDEDATIDVRVRFKVRTININGGFIVLNNFRSNFNFFSLYINSNFGHRPSKNLDQEEVKVMLMNLKIG